MYRNWFEEYIRGESLLYRVGESDRGTARNSATEIHIDKDLSKSFDYRLITVEEGAKMIHQDGLVHISQMTERYIKHPLEVVSVGDIVDVQVMSVDLNKKRIQLTMKIDHSK